MIAKNCVTEVSGENMDSKTKADNIKHLKSTPFNKPKKYSGYNQYKKTCL